MDKAALAKRGEAGCFVDDCEIAHCKVCGSHLAGSFLDWLGPVDRHGLTCTSCDDLTEEEQEVVRRARAAKWHWIAPELFAPAAPVADDPEIEAYIDELNDEAEAERRADRMLEDSRKQREDEENFFIC